LAVTLYADTVRVLTDWTPPNLEQAGLRQRFLDLLAGQPDAVRRDHPGAHITASVLVVDAEGERVLLCLHGRMHRWVQLGGHLEDQDPTLVAAGRREATEESGITGLQLDPEPIHLDVHRVDCRYGPSDHYDVRFAAIAPADAKEQVSDESAALGWFAPDALPSPLAHATEALVAPALATVRNLREAQLRSGAGHLGA
jgi:8-oxo-dGTP pyrophosphatase MutT (NUDIX family)